MNSQEFQSYINDYVALIKENEPNVAPDEMGIAIKTGFKIEMKLKIENDEVICSCFKYSLAGLTNLVLLYETCVVNRYKFCTMSIRHLVQELWRNVVLMTSRKHVFFFKCDGFNSARLGVQVDKNHVITFDVSLRLRSNNVFILANQVNQMYDAPNVLSLKIIMHMVVTSKCPPHDEYINAPRWDSFREEQSRPVRISFSFFAFAQYGNLPITHHDDDGDNEEEEEEE